MAAIQIEDTIRNLRAGGGKAVACSRDLGAMHQRLHRDRDTLHITNCLSQLFHSCLCSPSTYMLGNHSLGSICRTGLFYFLYFLIALETTEDFGGGKRHESIVLEREI